MNTDKGKKSSTKKLIIVVTIFALLLIGMIVVSIIAAHKLNEEDSYAITVEYATETMTLHTPTDDVEIRYEYIEELIYQVEWYKCNLISGEENNKLCSGIYQYDENYDTFYQHIYKDVYAYICFYYKGQYYVFNLSSVDKTRTCYEKMVSSLSGIMKDAESDTASDNSSAKNN